MPSTVGINMNFAVTGLKALEDASAAVNTISNANKVIKISIDPNEVASLKLLATVDVKKLASLASLDFSGLNTTGLLSGVSEVKKALDILLQISTSTSAIANINKTIKALIKSLSELNAIPDITKAKKVLTELQVLLNGFNISNKADLSFLSKLLTQINKLDQLKDVEIKKKLDSVRASIEHFITLPMNNSNLLKFLEQINLLNRGLNQNTQNIQNNVSNMGMALSSLGLNVGIGGLKSMVDELQHLEKTILQVGIAGGLGEASMKQLRGTFYNLSMTTGLSANEVAVAAETIIKTGQDFESTMKILEASTKLAVATGENLNYVAEALSKILLVLRIDADDTTEVMNKLMSVVNKTPASMRSMMEMLKQSNAGFANFIDMTSKSGVELEGYKKKILDLELSMGGGLSLLGRRGFCKIAVKSFNCGNVLRTYTTKIA